MLKSLRRGTTLLALEIRRHIAALAVFTLWAIVSVRIFWFVDANSAAAQAGNYGTLTMWALVFVGAVVGLRSLRPEQ